MALATLPISPAKPTTVVTTIPQFPHNPKTLILQQCRTTRDLNQVHAHLIKTRILLNPAITENILESASILLPKAMDYALSIFHNVDEPDSLAYNIMIRSLIYQHSPLEAILLFKNMCENSVEPDEFMSLKVCSRLRALREGEQIYSHIVKCGFKTNGFIENTMIRMYASCGELDVACRVFDGLPERARMAWNSMMAGYLKIECWGDVMTLFVEMLKLGFGFDEVTLISVLTACGRLANLELGEWIGEYIEANGLKGNIALVTSLVDMYAKCGQVDTARQLFDRMDRRYNVAWSAMISGYSQADRCREALGLFHDMQKANVDPNEVTLVSVLSSCAVLGALETGKWVKFYIMKKKMKLTVTLGTTLIDFYAKCGCVDSSIEVFNRMPSVNVISWTMLIQGLVSNGQGMRALEYFQLMQEKNIKPNYVTFIAVPFACSHAGLVDEGQNLFTRMSRDFRIEPRIEHYGSMVDILGRAGLIEEVYQFIKNMPIQPNVVVWRTLLASCRAQKNVEIGEESLKRITRFETPHSRDYIMLSNIYASVGRTEDAL
ncbi:pentatricopeptide repeat-containing protein At2g22410, mitochondrial-like [Malus sylvestris]|uniref:pentatricopeptide repeat-containing protein At2g22410, mitochondrial-like n=1 Tax=Malus sylvestris TaxID=3752 RepID=UPI0021ACFE5E|nr:pentatricopeptide repeat-containing protein At2g22410, mitochondrial-like [Malus sylvestris]